MKITAYHGTNCKFNKFNNETSDDTNKVHEIFFTTNLNEAKDYAVSRTGDLGGKATIIKAIVTINNPMPLLLKDSEEKIMEYAVKNNEETQYIEMIENFQGKETIEFAEYVATLNNETGADVVRSILGYWSFDGCANGEVYTVFNAEQIEIIENKGMEEYYKKDKVKMTLAERKAMKATEKQYMQSRAR